MAKVIDCYAAEAGGSSTMYYYRYPDNTSEATRIYTGEAIYLAADYLDSMSGNMYRMVDPEGWIQWYHVQNIQPVYKTITDKCAVPSAVTLDVGAKTLVITGGDGGDLNEWIGFGVSHRERAVSSTAWGAWSQDEVITTRSYTVSSVGGMVRQYRVRTLGAAGSGYYSEYAVCDTLLNGNTAAHTPVVLLPLSGMESCARRIAVTIECPPEPDGESMSLQRRMDQGAWETAASLAGAGGVVCDVLDTEEGSHTLSYRLLDAAGESGGEDSITFVCAPPVWKRSIAPGDVIANRQISFAQDITEMLMYLNKLRAFYGLTAIALPGRIGGVFDWHRQLDAMQMAVDECRIASGQPVYEFDRPVVWPSADQINQMRTALEYF